MKPTQFMGVHTRFICSRKSVVRDYYSGISHLVSISTCIPLYNKDLGKCNWPWSSRASLLDELTSNYRTYIWLIIHIPFYTEEIIVRVKNNTHNTRIKANKLARPSRVQSYSYSTTFTGEWERQGSRMSRTNELTFRKFTVPAFPQLHCFSSPSQYIRLFTPTFSATSTTKLNNVNKLNIHTKP